ncbi:receptor-interacting serine/threonine-protein kinase 4-like [Astyanax mexicanus]|uniref:Receptor-interacting serine/threonine-protein kinase 4-like n=1 Tax=Astyanax mexicanus TaxID=7994 RepID=A0A8T2KQ24_ASTMX|nr:receptor-interacting serine/threonine-protein kinase 4-like [Astyanax mexicanus]
MELASYSLPAVIRNDSLDFWQLIGCGGFGKIFRAKHLTLRLDVAVKLLRCDDGSNSTLLREANLMHHGGNPYVLRILGVYEGQPKGEEASQFGLVMEYMERGSLVDLQRALNGPPPWSLAFRIAHQIALGMNFLHQLDPPLLHLDLKPSNVLLDDSLNAKLTDFGLAKVARSVSKTVKEEDGEMGGTTSYMPPEAFQSVSYKPSFSSDIYSYGVLLWSVLTGKEPYDSVLSSLVRFRIPKGDRPDLRSVDTSKAAGLSDLTNLMQRCWNSDPNLRPSFKDCVDVTSDVYEMHRQEINDDVYATLKLLDNKSSSSKSKVSSRFGSPQRTSSKTRNGSLKGKSGGAVKTEWTPAQDTGGSAVSRPKESEPFFYPASSRTNHRAAARAPPTNDRLQMTQRQYSTPGDLNRVSISLSNVTGVQIGHNNYMNVNLPRQKQRQRHPTAPAQLNTSNAHQPSRPNPHPKP